MLSKDIAWNPFFVRTGRDVRDGTYGTYVRMYGRTDKGDAICPPHYKWRGHNNNWPLSRILSYQGLRLLSYDKTFAGEDDCPDTFPLNKVDMLTQIEASEQPLR